MIHERITKDIKYWIKIKAPGAKDTKGCSKKYHFPNFHTKVNPEGCRCGIEGEGLDLATNVNKRIIGGVKFKKVFKFSAVILGIPQLNLSIISAK